MAFRFLVFSDLHLNLWNYGADLTPYGKNTRLEDQVEFLAHMREYALKNSIKTVFFCGDLFHTHDLVKTEVLQAAVRSFSYWCDDGIRAHFVVGNHDFADRAGMIHALDFLKELDFTVADTAIHTDVAGFPVSMMPYTESEDALHEFLHGTREKSLMFMHQGVAGVELNSKGFSLRGEILTEDRIPDDCLAFVGHYHSHKVVKKNLIIPGSPMQLTWADAGENRGFLDCEVDEDLNLSMTQIHSRCPLFMNMRPGNALGNALRNFVRFHEGADPLTEGEEAALKRSARSLEVVPYVEQKENLKIEDKTFDSFNDLFDEFMKSKELDDDLVKIGKQLIGGKYGDSKTSS
jgi:DNA repair exonuclease SbcCD nuclease subunit